MWVDGVGEWRFRLDRAPAPVLSETDESVSGESDRLGDDDRFALELVGSKVVEGS